MEEKGNVMQPSNSVYKQYNSLRVCEIMFYLNINAIFIPRILVSIFKKGLISSHRLLQVPDIVGVGCDAN